MTGERFESEFCELLKATGYWALNIPKNKYGAQPFDVIAMHGNFVMAIDCKVCGKGILSLDRIEDNQWTAFETMNDRTSAWVGVAAYYKGDIYYLPYSLLLACREQNIPSVRVSKLSPAFEKEDIKDILGRYME